MSLFSSIQLANNALLAAQLGIQVTGNNIANANTPGYIRQSVVLTPAPTQRYGDLLLGMGVDVSAVIQRTDKFLEERHRAAVSDLANGDSLNVVDDNIEEAQKVVNNAIAGVSQLRGRLGAFQKNIVGATIRSLGIALENTSAAESSIRDTDFASETANLTRSQILVNASTNVLAIANSQPQSVLQLLG